MVDLRGTAPRSPVCKTGVFPSLTTGPMVPSPCFEQGSPVLQTGAFTRLAYWAYWSREAACNRHTGGTTRPARTLRSPGENWGGYPVPPRGPRPWQGRALLLSYIRMVGDPGVDPGWRCFTDT